MEKCEWVAFLKQPKRDKTDEDWFSAGHNSISWAACAVGCRLDLPNYDASDMVSRRSTNSWIYKRLTPKALKLGMEFHEAIKTRNQTKAKITFNKIQKLDRVLKNV